MVREYTKDTTASELIKDLAGEIANKTILVTGVSQGTLGGIFLQYIAEANPSRLILAGRSLSKAQQTADTLKAAHPDIDVRTLQIDLSSLAAVREAAAEVNSWEDVPHIDVLVNNAGIMAVPHQVSVDGFEMQFASNHFCPFLFTNLIMDKILASKTPRIVNVSSSGHRLNPIRFFDYNFRVCTLLDLSQGSLLTSSRTARRTTDGRRTASPRQPTCSWPFLWPRSLPRVA